MSIEKCLANEMLGGKLGIIGFLSSDGLMSYRRLSGLDFFDVPEDDLQALITERPTDALHNQLHSVLQTTITTLKCRNPWVDILAVATPALDLPLLGSDPGFKVISINQMITAHCLAKETKQIGLLGTAWDTAKTGPLAVALEQQGIQTWEPEEDTMRQLMSGCVKEALRGTIHYKNKTVAMADFCLEVISQMLHEAVGMMEVLLICNPELRQLRPKILEMFQQRRKFAKMPEIVDVTELYWKEVIREMSQHQAKTSG